jgi:hypothetical protein
LGEESQRNQEEQKLGKKSIGDPKDFKLSEKSIYAKDSPLSPDDIVIDEEIK